MVGESDSHEESLKLNKLEPRCRVMVDELVQQAIITVKRYRLC